MVKKELRDEMVIAIMNEFDFNKVRDVMRVLKWQYVNSDTIPPSIRDIRKMALVCLNRVKYSEKFQYCSTGGFSACFLPSEDEDGSIKLSFDIEEFEVTESEIN